MTRISIAGDGINVLGPLPIISGEGRKCDSKYLKQNGQDDQGPKLSLRANTVLGVETGIWSKRSQTRCSDEVLRRNPALRD
jgi:hypothetical protein